MKHYAGSVPVEELREVFGVAITMGRLPELFTSGTLTQAAADSSSLAPVAVVRYVVETCALTGMNEEGIRLINEGMSTASVTSYPLFATSVDHERAPAQVPAVAINRHGSLCLARRVFETP